MIYDSKRFVLIVRNIQNYDIIDRVLSLQAKKEEVSLEGLND